MKHCKRCGLDRPVTEFAKNSRYADGLWCYCKPCENTRMAARRAADPERAKAIMAASVAKHRDAINARKRARRAVDPTATKIQRKTDYAKYRDRELAAMRAWKAQNHERMREQRRERYHADVDAARARQQVYRDANPGKARSWRMGRVANQLNATPAWANRAAIDAIYAVAVRVTACTGIPYEVDHIVPLQASRGRTRVASGLHVEYNLRVVPRRVNRTKSNQHSAGLAG